MLPFISIVVIGYNVEEYIKECIDSIINIDYDKYEIIFVDDGSTDGTFEIVKNIKNDKLNCYKKENGGIVSARKYGVLKSKGEYIVFVDGDDKVNSSIINSYLNGVNKGKEMGEDIDIVVTDTFFQHKDKKYYREKSLTEYGLIKNEEYIYEILSGRMLHFMFSKMYKRSFLIEAEYMEYADINMAEDLMTNAQLGLFLPKVIYIDEPNYYYRLNNASMSRIANPNILNQAETLQIIEDYYKKNNKYNLYRELLNFNWFLYAYGYLSMNWEIEFKRKLISKCREKLYGYNKNKYYIDFINGVNTLARFKFYLYYKNSVFAGAFDKMYFALKSILKRKD